MPDAVSGLNFSIYPLNLLPDLVKLLTAFDISVTLTKKLSVTSLVVPVKLAQLKPRLR